MNSLLLSVIALVGYIFAYKIYGRYISKKIFSISAKNKMPSYEYQDNVDYVPTKKNIVFGHHFTTIAGLGPIVGPALGIFWGWLPAFLWVFLGSIFMGGVHDFSTLIISARKKGKTIADLTGDIISPQTRYAFQFLIQFLLLIVLAVFALIVGTLFIMYPESILPVWFQIPIAIWLGIQIRKGKNDLVYSIISLLVMYATIVLSVFLFEKYPYLGVFLNKHLVIEIWCAILFIYVFFASTVPVHKLLQPRDYINSHQLFVAMILIFTGLLISHPIIDAPAINKVAFDKGNDSPAMLPSLFIIIACGAISGFHSIASSGTTVKQVENEKDTLYIGYGGMLTESFLAVLVLLSIAGGLSLTSKNPGTFDAFNLRYGSWNAIQGLAAKLDAFITGAANLFYSFGIPVKIGKPMIAVFIVSFANTTLDSATRIQRLSLQEIFSRNTTNLGKYFKNRYFATLLVVIAAAVLTFLKPGGSGAMVLWPLFGALNQLLAALGLGIVSLYLILKKKNYFIAFIPMILVLIVTVWATILNLISFIEKSDFLLLIISGFILFLTTWLLISGVSSVFRKAGL